MEVNIELLIGTKVSDLSGINVGRIEELRFERDGESCRIQSYLIGGSAMIERLSAWTLVRPVARALRARKLYSLYEVPWQDMDLNDPEHPKLRVAKADLRHAK